MIFESLSAIPRSGELIGKAFSQAACMGRAKQNKLEAQQSVPQTASNILSDNLENIVIERPDFETVDPFYYELAGAIVDVSEVRKSLSKVMWTPRQVDNIARKYQSKLRRTDTDLACKHQKRAFARMASVVEKVGDDLLRISETRGVLRDLPDIRPGKPTIAVTGYSNVGKSSFVNDMTRVSNEIACYPFTAKGVQVGYLDRNCIRYQIIDTPGLLDRLEDEYDNIRQQVASALEHLAGAVLFITGASGACDYPIESQLELRDAVKVRLEERDIPVLTVYNKSDRSTGMDTDIYMSVETGENVETVFDAAIEATGFESDIPSSCNE